MRLARPLFSFLIIFAILGAWMFSGWPQVWRNPPFPPEVQEARAATATAFPGTTAGTNDAVAGCSDNMGWDGTGSPGNASASDDVYLAEGGNVLDNGETSDELHF